MNACLLCDNPDRRYDAERKRYIYIYRERNAYTLV